MAARGLAEPAHFAHELARGGADLLIGGNDVGLAKCLDAAAHAHNDTEAATATIHPNPPDPPTYRPRCGGSSGRSCGASRVGSSPALLIIASASRSYLRSAMSPTGSALADISCRKLKVETAR
jgi:hypothetical protein